MLGFQIFSIAVRLVFSGFRRVSTGHPANADESRSDLLRNVGAHQAASSHYRENFAECLGISEVLRKINMLRVEFWKAQQFLVLF